MRSAFALRIFSGKNILNFGFHGRGRGGKRHLQRRFLRKRGAAGKFLVKPQGLRERSLPRGELSRSD